MAWHDGDLLLNRNKSTVFQCEVFPITCLFIFTAFERQGRKQRQTGGERSSIYCLTPPNACSHYCWTRLSWELETATLKAGTQALELSSAASGVPISRMLDQESNQDTMQILMQDSGIPGRDFSWRAICPHPPLYFFFSSASSR